jgi:hypothetical protein
MQKTLKFAKDDIKNAIDDVFRTLNINLAQFQKDAR